MKFDVKVNQIVRDGEGIGFMVIYTPIGKTKRFIHEESARIHREYVIENEWPYVLRDGQKGGDITITESSHTSGSLDKERMTLPVDEAQALHPGRFILMKITKFDLGSPSEGQILTSCNTLAEANEKIAQLRQAGALEAPYCVLPASRLIRSASEWNRLLDSDEETGNIVNVSGRWW